MEEARQRVGVKELKDSLSSYLRRVRSGETLVVTDRGQPIARLVPPDWPEGLIQMLQRGELIPPERPKTLDLRPAPYRRGTKLLSDIVIEDRHR